MKDQLKIDGFIKTAGLEEITNVLKSLRPGGDLLNHFGDFFLFNGL
jgi:hypothetical protein